MFLYDHELILVHKGYEPKRELVCYCYKDCLSSDKSSISKVFACQNPSGFELSQLAACVLMMFYLDLSYRGIDNWLLATDKVCQVLGIKRVPDHIPS